jgi:hypothetical protein
MPQISLKRLFQAVACLCVTFAYASIELRASGPGSYDFDEVVVRTAFVGFSGIGVSAGVLFSKASIGVFVTLVLLTVLWMCIGWAA